MNFNRLETIKLDNNTIDDLGRWSRTVVNNLIPSKSPIKEGVITWDINLKGIGETANLYFKNETDKYFLQLFFDQRPYTHWKIKKQVINSFSFEIEKLPDTVEDLNLLRQMTSIWASTLSYIATFWEDETLVISKQVRLKKIKKGNKQPSYTKKNIIELNIPNELPKTNELPVNYEQELIKTYKQGVEVEALELDSTKDIHSQINSHLDSYYKQWLKTSIPALEGKTPIESSKTVEGRKNLENLFDYIKKMPSSVPFPEAEIRKELGI